MKLLLTHLSITNKNINRSLNLDTMESRSAIYKIRWEILVIVVSLILIAVAVYTIPNDYVLKMLREREKEFNTRHSVEGSGIVGEILKGSNNQGNINTP